MKRILTFVLALSMALSLAACGGKADGDARSDGLGPRGVALGLGGFRRSGCGSGIRGRSGQCGDRQGQHHQQDQEQRGDLFLKQFHVYYLQNDSIRK